MHNMYLGQSILPLFALINDRHRLLVKLVTALEKKLERSNQSTVFPSN